MTLFSSPTRRGAFRANRDGAAKNALMSNDPVALRSEETPCLLFPELVAQGGGLQRSVQERASLYAKRWERVLLLTTGFTPNWYSVPVALKERGSLHPRVKVRNFFAHSDVDEAARRPAARRVRGRRRGRDHDPAAEAQGP